MTKFTIFLLFIIGIIIYRNYKKAQRMARMKMETERKSQPRKPKGEILYDNGEVKVFKGLSGKKDKEKDI